MINNKFNYRINKDILLQIDKTQTNYLNFFLNQETIEDTVNEQFLLASTLFEQNQTILENTVWNFGIHSQMVNSVYNQPMRISEEDLGATYHLKHNSCKILFRQGFRWNGKFGVLLVIRGMVSNKIYFSQVFKIDDLLIANDTKELIDNDFWVAYINFEIPKIPNFENENLTVAFEEITFDDIVSSGPDVGLLLNYPTAVTNFEPLITDELLPSYISVEAEILNSMYLRIKPVSLESGKTLQQSLLDYFNVSGQVVPININHVIKYGNDVDGYHALRIANEDNPFGQIVIGLLMNIFTQTINIFISTEFELMNKLMKREQQLVFDYTDVVNSFLQNILPEADEYSVYPVTVVQENVINQNVIETVTEQKIVTITQPIFVAIEKHDIEYAVKLISFEELTENAYLLYDIQNNKMINSKQSSDGKYYFELGSIPKPEKNSKYQVFSLVTKNLITEGMIIVES